MTQRPLFSADQLRATESPTAWRRTNNAPGRRNGSLGVVWWLGSTGYQVRHCGHPTALWPWYGLRPDGSLILGRNGRAFQLVADAKQATEDDWRKAQELNL